MKSECQANSVKTRASHPVARVGAAVEVLGEQLLALRHGPGSRASSVSNCSGVIAPLLSHQTASSVRGVAHDELVLGRAAGVDAGVGDERAALASWPRRGRGLLVEGGRLKVPVDALRGRGSRSLSAMRAVVDADIVHGLLLPDRRPFGAGAAPDGPSVAVRSALAASIDLRRRPVDFKSSELDKVVSVRRSVRRSVTLSQRNGMPVDVSVACGRVRHAPLKHVAVMPSGRRRARSREKRRRSRSRSPAARSRPSGSRPVARQGRRRAGEPASRRARGLAMVARSYARPRSPRRREGLGAGEVRQQVRRPSGPSPGRSRR